MWQKDNGRRVIVGMSGGVDSAVAAAQLLEAGHEVVGLFMKNWEEDDEPEYCAAERDLADARDVCHTLGIQLEAVNFSHEYWENVFVHFLQEYKSGRTPNPDILCNREIKFKTFLQWALELGANYIATGHYAQKGIYENHFSLKKGLDAQKDQSYFLYTLDQLALKKTLFPIGHLQKKQVRKTAEEIGLSVKDKKDSTGICFIGERRFKEFLAKYLPAQPGKILSIEGKTIGRHSGAMYYTIGQRNGLGIGGTNELTDNGQAWFVAVKDITNNVLIAVQGHDHPALFNNVVITERVHWISKLPATLPFKCTAKTRYRQADQECELVMYNDRQARIVFSQAQRAIAPGQSLVFYNNEHCLGGAVIEQGLNMMA